MFVLGLTGCIATGKSSVSRYLASKGIALVDADIGARQVVEIGSPGLQAIADYFGPDVLLEDGSLNRKKLGSLIFSDSEKEQPSMAYWTGISANGCVIKLIFIVKMALIY